MKKITIILLVLGCIATVLFSTCKKSTNSSGASAVAVRLKDAPMNCDHLRVHVKGVKIHSSGNGWITLPINDTVIDILQLKDTSMFIGTINLNAGTIDEVHLMLGSQDSITVDGITYVLSLMDDDVILRVNDTITPGTDFTLVLDLNAENSVFDEGGHHYGMHGIMSSIWRKGRHHEHDGDD